jgi:limonene 1,2-monooxygenase
MSTQGLMALPTQWGFAEDAAKKHGTTVSRADWRVLLSWHIAESREQAQREAGAGLMKWHNEYTVGTLQRPGVEPFTSPEDAVEKTAGGENAASTIGTPDDLVRTIKNLIDVSGGVGTIIGFVHDWANPENTRRSWDMVARYVVPEINGYVAGLRKSRQFVVENRAVFERAGQAVMAKIMANGDDLFSYVHFLHTFSYAEQSKTGPWWCLIFRHNSGRTLARAFVSYSATGYLSLQAMRSTGS